MKYFGYLIISLLCLINVRAQLSIVNTYPVDGAVGVQLTDTVSVTFSNALDTLKKFTDGNYLLTNAEPAVPIWYSQDLKTIYIKSDLTADTNYYLLFYSVAAEDGSVMETPALIEFTTSSVFSGVNVSGTVSVNSGIISSQNSVIGLSVQDLSQGEPMIVNGAVADANGNFVVHHVKDGTYFPLAAKDVNTDGEINPGYGDLLGILDSINVAGADLLNLDFVLTAPELISFSTARLTADSIQTADLPSSTNLCFVSAYNIDSVGRTDNWTFYYIDDQSQNGYRVEINLFNNEYDTLTQDTYNWVSQMRPIADSIWVTADPENFVINADNGNGNYFRHYPLGDSLELEIELNLGNLSRANFGDIIPGDENFYWGLDYRVRELNYVNWDDFVDRIRFLANYQTGDILIVSDVEDRSLTVPSNFKLEQNYPNPFNPTTIISYSIPDRSFVSLKVFNVIGQLVTELVNEQQDAGTYNITFDASNLSSGIYFYKLTAGNFIKTKKLVLTK